MEPPSWATVEPVSAELLPDDSLASRHPIAGVAALAALGGAAFCFVTGENLPVGLLPQLSAGLRVSLSAIGLLVTIYAVVGPRATRSRERRSRPREPSSGGAADHDEVVEISGAAAGPVAEWEV